MGQARSSRAFSIFHCIFVSSFYWAFLLTYTTTGSKILFPTAVFKRIQRAPALLYGLRSKRLLRPRASAVPGATTTASTLPRQWRPAGRLDLSPRPALLLRIQRAPALLYGLRSKRLLRPRASAVPGATTTASTLPRQWRPAGRLDLSPRPALLLRIQRAPALLYGLRCKRLLRPRASPVPGATTTASTFPRQWRPAGRLDLSPRPALLLVLQSCFQLRSSCVSSVPPCTALRTALQKATSAMSITCSRSDHCCFYIASLVASCWETGLVSSPCTTTGSAILFPTAVLKRTQRAPLHYSTVCAPKGYFGHEHQLFQERPLLLLHSLASGVLLVD
ncbi:uncharacterized protein [Dermacentor albipictus]|uniref:uncharacterized protein isoform X1 n=1 Tax=Dermacentor albipictus TaxID=60249 RepID=UPI0031FC3AD2